MTTATETHGETFTAPNGVTYPIFRGRCYCYEDARRRVPEAWRLEVEGGELEGGGRWSRERYHDIAPKGLGHWEVIPNVSPEYGHSWIHIRPNGLARPIGWSWNPRPLAKPGREKARCHCGPHTCTACGGPWYIEIHGVADGYCTNCHNAG